ncbi:MAG: biotin carboxylase N-terminal domain-containing protein, partial [Pseudomonadales bacterium]
MFERVLIANRGEIAIRIARAAASLGVESIGVYAPVDSLSLHTRATSEALELRVPGGDGGDPIGAYLDAQGLVELARANGCDAVHPGYGFLSENAAFAALCESAGINFIGPSPAALALFGDKVRSRRLAQELDIPVIPGSPQVLASAAEAVALAGDIGFPVMLKASAGGGGRGMRVVEDAEAMTDAFERCRGEAQAAFGNAELFLEQLISRPRHVEVQILADSRGDVVHLHERDCSVQFRNQKVVEIAPAPGLDVDLREKIHADAVKLAQAAKYRNAGTVEFLVLPETGEYFFIECNPRIQVEHTITEQVMGVDLVEAQFRIACGATLEDIGLADQDAVGAPRGFAVQARVVAQGAGTLTAYKEPSGVGIRVDANGYVGYAPPPQFDPLLAKVIGTSAAGSTFAAALDRTGRALDEFHITGLPTNLPQLRTILASETVRAGAARTSLLTEEPALNYSTAGMTPVGRTLALLDQQFLTLGASQAAAPLPAVGPSLPVGDGERGIEVPMAGRVVELNAAVGDKVAAGDMLLVVSAMKMESIVTAPCAGELTALQDLHDGDSVGVGQIVAVIAPSAESGDGTSPPIGDSQGAWGSVLEEVDALRKLAAARLQPGSEDPGVIRQRSRGKLNCRERIEMLLDDGSFREVGSIAGFASYDEFGEISAFTPANSVGGWGTIEGRKTIVCADDFTSRGGHADGAIGAKSGYLERLSMELLHPSVRLLDGSSGGGSVAAMVPEQKKQGDSSARESSGAIKAGRPRVAG